MFLQKRELAEFNPLAPDNIWDRIRGRLMRSPLVKFFRRKILLRKTLFAGFLLSLSLSLVVGAVTSPKRVTLTREQLETTRRFPNGTGELDLVQQTYSESNGIAVLEFDTSDLTSNVTKGLNPDNLTWQLFFGSFVDSSRAEMQVIPVTGNKVYVVVKNIPKNFKVFVISVSNSTVSLGNIDVNLRDYEAYKQAQKELESKNTNTEVSVGADAYFYISLQNEKLEEGKIEDLSREKFALQVFEHELAFQKHERERLEKAVTDIELSIAEDNKTLEQFTKEAKYLVGEDLQEKVSSIGVVNQGITIKEDRIRTAQSNIGQLDALIENLEKNIGAVKDGAYEFSFPVRSISRDLE